MIALDSLPLPALVEAFVRIGNASLDIHDPSQAAFADETQEIGQAILRRGEAGHQALRELLRNSTEGVRLLAACWLLDVDPEKAAPMLDIISHGEDFATASFARLRLLKARNDGRIPRK